MTELTWFILIIWLVLTLAFFKFRQVMLGGVAGLIGIFFGLTLLTDSLWLGFILIIFDIYVMYVAILGGERKKK